MQAGTSNLRFREEGQSPVWRKYLNSTMQISPKEHHTFAGMPKKGFVLHDNAEPRKELSTDCTFGVHQNSMRDYKAVEKSFI